MADTGENSVFIKALMIIGGVVAVLALVWGVVTLSDSSGGDSSSSSSEVGEVSENLPQVTDEDHIFGDEDAPVTIVKYSDFQCPACAQFSTILSRLLEEYPEDVRVAYRHFPLRSIHANAERAGRASEAAGRQGEFREYHDEVFETQRDWASFRGNELDEFFVELARGLDLDEEQFIEDYESEEVKEIVREELQDAQNLGLRSTPSFFLNGVRIQNPSGYQGFAELIEEEIQRLEDEDSEESENDEDEGDSEESEDDSENEESSDDSENSDE